MDRLDAAILAVRHKDYDDDMSMIESRVVTNGILIDVKSAFDPNRIRPDIAYWSL